jgi:hypothetical protein
MRAIFGIVSLLVVLAIVGLLAKKQFGAVSSTLSHASTPETAASLPAVSPNATPQAQSLQIQQQVKQKVEAGLQAQPKPADD